MIRLQSACALLLVIMAAACAPAATTPAPHANPLWNTRWVSADKSAGADAPTIEFIRDRANGFTGCNRWFAQVEARDQNHFRFIAIGATRRACEPDAMEIETAFLAALESTAAARTEDDLLVLYNAEGAPLARFEPQR